MSEFTGERVIPGKVNDDLWAEHIARYAFAQTFAGRQLRSISAAVPDTGLPSLPNPAAR